MFRFTSSTLRLAFALACVGASIPIAAQWIGVLKDPILELEDRKRCQSEAISLLSAPMLKAQQWGELQGILTVLVDRDSTIASIGVRELRGDLTVRTDHHVEMLKQLHSAGDNSFSLQKVPLILNDQQWGEIEFIYPNSRGYLAFTGSGTLDFVIFVFISGIVLYSIFIGRILKLMETTQVVPDRVRQALDTLTEGLLVLNEHGEIILANQAFADLINLDRETLSGKAADKLGWTNKTGKPEETMPWFEVKKTASSINHHLLVFKLVDNTHRILSVNAAPLDVHKGKVRGFLVSFRDVTHIEKHREELESTLSALQASRDEINRKNLELEVLATQDALTGCLNRRSFFERLSQSWDECSSSRSPLSCLMIDNDHFKSINDTYGHHVGDAVLRAVSTTIKMHFSTNGLVCRYGGEEFCIALPKVGVNEAHELAEKVRVKIENIQLDSPKELRISASIGVSALTFGAEDAQTLINQADACLYVAKRNGRNQVVVYQPGFEDELKKAGGISDRRSSETASAKIPNEAVSALLATLTHRDSATATHCRRVSELACNFAKGLLPNSMLEILEYAALLHDIGKVGVPDDILLKPGELTDLEWVAMRQYERIGTEIVADTFNCDGLTEILRLQQHPFKDYRYLLQTADNKHTSVASRILSICDSYDAMTSDRPHRPGKKSEEALAELRRCAGTQFDPELVEKFVSFIENRKPNRSDAGSAFSHESTIQLASQIQNIVRAVNSYDATELTSFTGHLAKVATHLGAQNISELALQLHHASEQTEPHWSEILSLTNELVEICREAQDNLLSEIVGNATPSGSVE